MIHKIENPAKNQVFIFSDNIKLFFSYDVNIAKVTEDETLLDELHDYSRTTITYRNKFLNMDSKTINKHIEQGSIKIVRLNNSDVYEKYKKTI